MRRNFLKSAMAVALVAGMAILGGASPAGAITVRYSTVGQFAGGDTPGENTYVDAARGIFITFIGVTSDFVDVPPESHASFGSFDTTGTNATSFQDVDSLFTLQIFQTEPELGGPLVFEGDLQGQLRINNSQAFVQFREPLSQTIEGSLPTIYTITEADNDTLGRVNLEPPSTFAGVSTIEAEINVIPEPSSLLLGALAAPALLIFLRKKGKVTV